MATASLQRGLVRVDIPTTVTVSRALAVRTASRVPAMTLVGWTLCVHIVVRFAGLRRGCPLLHILPNSECAVTTARSGYHPLMTHL